MRILVAGGAGYLGRRVVHHLSQVGFMPVVYDSLLYQSSYMDERADFVRGDVTHHQHLCSVLSNLKVDCVIWLAAIVGDAACMVSPTWARAVNVDALENLVDKFNGRLIFPSSCSVYGAAEGVSTESSPMNPQSLYAEMKVEAEQILAARPDTFILRLATLHGISERMRFDLAVNSMTRMAVEEHVVNVFGGNQHRPFSNVDDVAILMRDIIMNGYAPGTYNVATENMTISDVGQTIARVTGAQLNFSRTAVEDRRDYQVDSACARLELGYDPLYHVQDSVGHIKRLLESGRLRDTSERQYNNLASLREK